MKKIREVEHIRVNDEKTFTEMLETAIRRKQSLGYETDIQYGVTTHMGEVIYTALVIGRE